MIDLLDFLEIRSDRFSGNRHFILVDQAGSGKLLHDSLDPTRRVQVLQEMRTSGPQAAKVGSTFADNIEKMQIELDPGLTCNGGNMQNGVGGTSQGHIHGHGVFEGASGGDIPGKDISGDQIEDFHPRLFGQADSCR